MPDPAPAIQALGQAKAVARQPTVLWLISKAAGLPDHLDYPTTYEWPDGRAVRRRRNAPL